MLLGHWSGAWGPRRRIRAGWMNYGLLRRGSAPARAEIGWGPLETLETSTGRLWQGAEVVVVVVWRRKKSSRTAGRRRVASQEQKQNQEDRGQNQEHELASRALHPSTAPPTLRPNRPTPANAAWRMAPCPALAGQLGSTGSLAWPDEGAYGRPAYVVDVCMYVDKHV